MATEELFGTPETVFETRDYFEACVDTYRFLSQLFFKELTAEALDQLKDTQWPTLTGNDHLDAGYAKVRRYFNFAGTDAVTELAVEYARIFLAAGVYTKERQTAVPYESVFTSEDHTMMGDTRDDVVRRFKADGFAVNPDLHEPEDHISFLLEYLSVMNQRALELLSCSDRAGLERNLTRQLEFINGHVLNWLPTLADVADGFATLTFYPGFLLVARGTLEQSREMIADILADLSAGR